MYRKIIGVSLPGMRRVNRVFFPTAEKAKGRFLNYSSEYDTYAAVPFSGFCTAAKRAAVSCSDGPRRVCKRNHNPGVKLMNKLPAG